MRRESAPIWLGLDLGTQTVRAMAVSETGEVLGLGAQPLTSHRAPFSRHICASWMNSRAAIGSRPTSPRTPARGPD